MLGNVCVLHLFRVSIHHVEKESHKITQNGEVSDADNGQFLLCGNNVLAQ